MRGGRAEKLIDLDLWLCCDEGRDTKVVARWKVELGSRVENFRFASGCQGRFTQFTSTAIVYIRELKIFDSLLVARADLHNSLQQQLFIFES
jgi:hypothetical protein